MIRRFWFMFILCTCVFRSAPIIVAQNADSPVTSADVIAMTQAGLSDQIIIAKIKAHNKIADLSTDELINLKKEKVTDAVIAALIDPAAAVASSPVIVQSPLGSSSNPSGATTGLAGDPNDPMSPHDSGIYVFANDHSGKPNMIELERTAYQGAKTGGMFTSALTYGIAKAKSKAIIPGRAASIRVGSAQPSFYFYFDEKAAGLSSNSFFAGQNISSPNQFALIHLNVEKSSRSAEIGEFSMWGASSGNNQKDIVVFKSERVKPGLYKVTLSGALKRGEYCFMAAPVATSSYAGVAGTTNSQQLFDFGIDN